MVVARVDRRGGETLGPITGFSFIWSNTGIDAPPRTRLAIPPGVARRIDLMSIHKPSLADGGGGSVVVSGDGQHETPARLAINPRPTGGSSLLGAGSYTIIVAVTAHDTDAAFYAVDVTFDGLWWGAGAIREHLKVGAPTLTRETAI